MVMFKRNRLACAVAVAASMSGPAHAQDALELQPTTVVSASGFEQNIKDAPATISVITAEELKKRSYTDITDALKNVAGVQIAGGGVEQSIMVRGMTSAYTLFLIDGRPAQGNDAFGLRGSQAGTPINFLPPIESIERIEVIRGPASALYGSDAMGGVINIITKKVTNELSGSITAEYTTPGSSNKLNEDTFQTSAYLNVPLIEDVLGLQLTGALHDQEESNFVGGGDSAATDPKYEKRNAGAKLSWNLNDQNSVTVGHTYTKQERWHNPGKSLALTTVSRGQETPTSPTYSESIKKNYFLDHEGNYENFLLKSYLNYDHSENPTTTNATTGKGIEYEVITANTQATYFLGSHTLTGGLTHKYEDLEDGSNALQATGPGVEINRYQNSIYLEDNWSLTDDFILTLSGRYDDNQVFGGQFSPKIYGVYHLNDNFTLKGGVTTGYKAPDLRSSATDYGSSSMGGTNIGNPDLIPETSVSREIGLAYENLDLGLNTSVTAYVIDYEDKINRTGLICATNVVCEHNGVTYAPHPNGYATYENVDEAELRGIEFTLDYRILDNLTYRHSYTYTETEQKSGEHKGRPLNDTAKHMLNTSLDWQATDRLNLWTQYNYRGKTSGRWQTGQSGSSSNGVRYPSYSFVDIGVGFRATNDLTLKAGIYNIGNKEVSTDSDYAYNLDGRRFIFSLTQAF